MIKDYKGMGCKFVVIKQDFEMTNLFQMAQELAVKAKMCQELDIVPIVRPILKGTSGMTLNQVEELFGNSLEYLVTQLQEHDVLM